MEFNVENELESFKTLIITCALEGNQTKSNEAFNKAMQLLTLAMKTNDRNVYDHTMSILTYTSKNIDFSKYTGSISTGSNMKAAYEQFGALKLDKDKLYQEYELLVKDIIVKTNVITLRINNHLEIDEEDKFIANVKVECLDIEDYIKVKIAVNEEKYVGYLLTTNNSLTIKNIKMIIKKDLKNLYKMFKCDVIVEVVYEDNSTSLTI